MNKQEDEKIKVLNLLTWLQVTLYASDNCENISWFFNKQTKFAVNQLDNAIKTQHGKAIKELWDVEGTNMHMVMHKIEKFAQVVNSIPFYRIEEATIILNQYFKNE